MSDVAKRDEEGGVETFDTFTRLDRLFDEWTRMLPFWRPSALAERLQDQMIRVDQFRDGDTLVVKAEMPGIDPDRDVEVTVADHTLHIRAERRTEEEVEDGGYVRRELRTGTFSRALPLPRSVSEEDISASYDQGILEVRVPMPEDDKPAARTIPVTRR